MRGTGGRDRCGRRGLAGEAGHSPWSLPGPPGRIRPGPAALAAALPARPADPRPGPPRVPPHPPGTPRSGQRAETRPTGPGRPPGSTNRRPATRHDVGKTVKREEPRKKDRKQKA